MYRGGGVSSECREISPTRHITDGRVSINLPFGGVAAAMLVLFQPARPPLGRAASYKGYNKDMLMAVVNCDWVGMLISMGWGVVAILFMQWGGVTRPWNDGGVIACAVLTGVIPFIFLLWEWYIGPKAMFKFYLLKRRTILYVPLRYRFQTFFY